MPPTRDWFSAGTPRWTEPADTSVEPHSSTMASLLASRAKKAGLDEVDLIQLEAKDREIQVLLEGDRIAWHNTFREAMNCALAFKMPEEDISDSVAFTLSRLPDAVRAVDTKEEFRQMVIVLTVLGLSCRREISEKSIHTEGSDYKELQTRLLTELGQCTPFEQIIFRAFLLESHSPQEVAVQLGLSVNRVYQVTRKVRLALSKTLQNENRSERLGNTFRP